MGVHPNIGYKKFPKQGNRLNKEVSVCFDYQPSDTIKGVVVRDDIESPHLGLIQLEDGRIVRFVECQYSIK